MKTVSVLVALGLAVQQVTAHGHGWLGADSFSCPSNTNNHCNPEEESGFAWGGLKPGSSVDEYSGYKFKGYTCQDSFAHSKREVLLSRGIQSKCIAGTASKDHASNPSFSCTDKAFSIDHVQVSTEEDQDLEFTYGYSNGATCKHIAPCSKSGSTIKNTQCGGADSVTVGVPKHAPKDTCSFGIHSVGFNCGSASVPVPSSTIVPVVSTHVVPPVYTIPGNSSSPATPTAPSVYYPPGTAPIATPTCTSGCSTIPIYSYSNPVFSYSTPIGTAPGSSYVPVTSPSVPVPSSSETSNVPTAPESTPSVPTSYPVESTTENIPSSSATSPVESTPSSPATYPVESIPTVTPSSPATYPVESSSESTPSSPATYPVSSESSVIPTGHESTPSAPATYTAISSESVATYPVQSHPAGSTSSALVSSSLGNSPTEAISSPNVPETTVPAYTTAIVYTTLTTCPVTSTLTTSGVVTYQTYTTVSTLTGTSISTISVHTGVPSTPETPVTSGNSPIPASSSSSPAPSAPCPTVLPQCLNTWIKLTTCENNAASDCYCKNADFTKNVQDCVSSWSYDDNEIQAALSYLAGICAPHVAENPGIVTHVPKTITLVPTPVATSSEGVTAGPTGSGVGYHPETVISLSTATVVPVTYSTGPSSGSPIPSSSTTSVIETAVTVPQVKFTTGNSPVGASGVPDVGLAAGSPAPVPATSTSPPYGAGAGAGAGIPAIYGPTGASTFASVKPVGTAVSSPITPFTGAAGRVVSGGVFGVVVAGFVGFVVLI